MHVPEEIMRSLGSRRQAMGWFRFQCNGTSNPPLNQLEGPLAPFIASMTYSATGIVTIVFTPEFKAVTNPKSGGRNPIIFDLQFLPDSLANNLGIAQIGLWNNSTRTLVIQTLAANSLTTGAAPAGNAQYVQITANHAELAN